MPLGNVELGGQEVSLREDEVCSGMWLKIGKEGVWRGSKAMVFFESPRVSGRVVTENPEKQFSSEQVTGVAYW